MHWQNATLLTPKAILNAGNPNVYPGGLNLLLSHNLFTKASFGGPQTYVQIHFSGAALLKIIATSEYATCRELPADGSMPRLFAADPWTKPPWPGPGDTRLRGGWRWGRAR